MWTTITTIGKNVRLKYFINSGKKVWRFSPVKKTKHKRHAKSGSSFNKGSKNYIKKYRGQG